VTARKAAAPQRKASPSAVARQAEAEDGYVNVEQCGVTLRIPIGGKVPAAVTDAALEGGDLANWKALKAWVGKEQWALLVDAGMTNDDVEELDGKLGQLLGN
jgi:hypothetical protein